MLKNRLTYALVLFLCWLFIYLYGERITYIALYSVILLPVISLATTLVSLGKLSISHKMNDTYAVKNDKVIYTVTLTNKGFFTYHCVKVVIDKIDALPIEDSGCKVVSIERGGSSELVFSMECLYRGVFEIGVKSIDILDMLGIFRFKQKLTEKITLTVYPTLAEIRNVPLNIINMSSSPSIQETSDEDYTIITDLRKYQPEDSFKKIHWKVSAKKNEFLVKNFQSVNLNCTVLALNNSKITFSSTHGVMERIIIEDKLIEGVISFAHYCLFRHYPVELYFAENEIHSRSESSYLGFSNLYNTCAGIQFNSAVEFTKIFEMALFKQTEFINIVLFTTTLDEATYSAILTARVYGHNIIVVFAETNLAGQSPTLTSEMIRSLFDSGVTVYYLPFDKGIGEVAV